MAVKLVTGYKGKDHVTAEQWADFNRGIFGDAAILPVGNKMETAIQTANQITIKDGVAVIDGRQVYIGYGESENIAIQSGTQGMLRRDIVVLEYTRNEDTGVEDVQFKVVAGTPSSGSAEDPAINNMDIRTGVSVSQKPFCRIRLNGTAIEGVDSFVQIKELSPHAFAAVVDNLESEDENLALSARQGMELKKMIDNRKMTKLWSGSVANGQEAYLSEDIDKYNFITCVFRKENKTYHNATFLTSAVLKANNTNTLQQILFTNADTSLYMKDGNKKRLFMWMSSSLVLTEVYGH